MGDVAMIVPVLRAALSQNPELDVLMVSRKFYAPLFKDLPNVKFIGVDLKNNYKGISGLYRLFRFLKKEQPQVIADFHDVLRTQILRSFFKLSGYKVKVIDKGRKEKAALVRPENKIFKPLKSTHERYADVLRNLGLNLDLTRKNSIVKPVLTNQVALFLNTFEGQTLIGIAPFAAHEGKQYPLDKIKSVIKKLLQEQSDINILLFGGGQKEKEVLADLEKIDRNRVVNVVGLFNFEEELQLISRLNLMVSMDSGNAHLAALYNVPVLTIWGATHPYAGFAPFNQLQEYQILPDLDKFPKLPTSIYGHKTFEGFEAVWETISPERIANKVLQIIAT